MIGTVINNYRIIDVLDASGGMGIVYRAEHVTMGQKAVIKQLLPHFNRNPQVVARFLNEARAAAAIDDPGIVKVFDQGTLPDGSAYLTMELLAGESLRARLRRDGALPPNIAIPLIRQAARAIGAAHRRGIIHRDLKPENLFLCPDPDLPELLRVKVLDFGIAKLADGAGGVLTQTGLPLGTPTYMAPEQWRSASHVDGRTDIYALGCVLYEMLVGRVPFPGPELPDYMDQHRFAAPPLPGAAHPSLAGYDGVIQRALAKNIEDRFASMDDLLAALPPRASAPGWAGVPVTAGPPYQPTPMPTPRALGSFGPGGEVPIATPGPAAPTGRSRKGWLIGTVAAVAVAGAATIALVASRDGSTVAGGSPDAPAQRTAAPPPGPDRVVAPSPDAHTTIIDTEPALGPADAPPRLEVLPVVGAGCPAIADADLERHPKPPRGKPTYKEKSELIVDFDLDQVAPEPDEVGAGGITSGDASMRDLGECSDAPRGNSLAHPGASVDDERSGLRMTVSGVEAAGSSGRGWPGVRCAYHLVDQAHAELYADLEQQVPAFNALTGVFRVGNLVYATLQFNGYAKEIGGHGNIVVALDLCTHAMRWRSSDMVSNAAVIVHGDLLITGYGFTAESHHLTYMNRFTGAVLLTESVPKSPEDMRIKDGKLYVRLYDGYMIKPLE